MSIHEGITIEDDMEELVMTGKSVEKKQDAKRTKRKKIEKLKRLIGMDVWEDGVPVSASDAMDPVMKVLEFIKDPMIHKTLTKDEYKSIHNGLIDAHEGIKLYMTRQDNKLKKVK